MVVVNSVIAPAVVILPTLAAWNSVNHRLPSGPAVIPLGLAAPPSIGIGNSVKMPASTGGPASDGPESVLGDASEASTTVAASPPSVEEAAPSSVGVPPASEVAGFGDELERHAAPPSAATMKSPRPATSPEEMRFPWVMGAILHACRGCDSRRRRKASMLLGGRAKALQTAGAR